MMARNAVQRYTRSTEVVDDRDRSEALRAYARQAKNKQLEIDAAEIRIRAERRIGELMQAQKETVGMAKAGRPKIGSGENPISDRGITLAEVGIDKSLAMIRFPTDATTEIIILFPRPRPG